ncbi:MAG TPA: hypothetical protein VME41_02685 [Stellaceae bacterium]|nr:hypothetical protein [Stellaceae bacterium]
MSNPKKLRELAGWYRAFAERTANTAIWDSRLRTAEDLEAEAARIEELRPRPVDDRGTEGRGFAGPALALSRVRTQGGGIKPPDPAAGACYRSGGGVKPPNSRSIMPAKAIIVRS